MRARRRRWEPRQRPRRDWTALTAALTALAVYGLAIAAIGLVAFFLIGRFLGLAIL